MVSSWRVIAQLTPVKVIHNFSKYQYTMFIADAELLIIGLSAAQQQREKRYVNVLA